MTSTVQPTAWRPTRWTWAWALCLALALRALVPNGYMPDANARVRGILALSICTAYDPAGVGAPLIPTHNTSGTNCLLCLLAHHASGSPLTAYARPMLLAPSADAIPRIAATLIAHVFQERGAPLGPRAPPRSDP
uniref:DUF2946 family protein n=1 Tax=Castellaniella defragrans TaxID=75697 RepID=UPI00333F0D92